MPPAKAAREFAALLDYMKGNRGFDFTGYKHGSLERRVQKRMQTVRVAGYGNYIDYLEVHPEEFIHLFNTILINVTSFFRDAPAWDFLRREVIPRIIEDKKPNQLIRVWSAGCASGEEAYSLAIALAEALGLDGFRSRVKIYGTDVDEQALTAARHATYSDRDLKEMAPGPLSKYFEKAGSHYVFRADLRRSVIFGRHDLLQDATISHIDLLVCRNTLMYFNAENQAKILGRFHYALNDPGYLFMGKAEMLLTQNTMFSPVNLKWRVFSRVARGSMGDRLLAIASGDEGGKHTGRQMRLREIALEMGAMPQIVVDRTGVLVLANERARTLFKLAPSDVGHLLQDLQLSYRPVEVRSHIEEAHNTRGAVMLKEVEVPNPPGESFYLDIQIAPALEADGSPLGTNITFVDVTQAHRLQSDLQELT